MSQAGRERASSLSRMNAHSEITLTIGGSAVRVVLLEDAAPRICSAFRASLPLDSFAVHAKFAGEELIAMLPFYEGPENEVPSVAPGDIGYYPARQTLCLFYGEIMPFASVSLFARVSIPTTSALRRKRVGPY